MGKSSQVSSNSAILAFRLTFVPCVEALLSFHIKEVHEKIKTFQCNLCERAFGQWTTLDRHVRNVHTMKNVYDVENEKKFQCRVCRNTFQSILELKDHLKAVHIFPKKIKKSEVSVLN